MTILKLTLMTAAVATLLSAHGPAKGKAVDFTAAVVDTGCYVSHDSKGPSHAACAETCAKAGVPLALLDEKTGAVYLPIASDHKNQNERLMPFIEKRVKVTGTVVTKGGMTGIVIKTLTAVAAN